MNEDADSSSYLSRAYKVAKIFAVSTASLVGVIISLVALDLSKGHWWVDIKFPLYGVVFLVVSIIAVCTFATIAFAFVVRDSLDALSFYRNKAKNLESVVSTLRDLAYTDPITGIANSNKLKEVIECKTEDKARCLVMLDLKNFGEVNKKHNHAIGDEYLRRFAQLVTDSSRRNEYLFKSRPLKAADAQSRSELKPVDVVRTFRKNSGGDEFFVLLDGTVIDGLGYLNRLRKRASEFEQMAFDIMGERRLFAFYAGVVLVGYEESYESVCTRVSECLGLALEDDSKRDVYWVESELPESLSGFQRKIIEETEALFANSPKARAG